MRRAFLAAAAVPWAITSEFLHTVLEIANGEGEGIEAVSARLGKTLDNTRNTQTRGTVAVIPINGPIFRHAGALGAISGGVSCERLALDFTTALENPDVKAILFSVDSPGGEVTGIHELAAMIYGARGKKPLEAYVGGSCASAALWLMSSCDRITVDATAITGSIGVVMALPDPKSETAKQIEIVSSNAPDKRVDVSTKDGRAKLLTIVDSLAAIFTSDVARGRGASIDTVNKRFGQGGSFVGAEAVDVGLVDAIGSYEGVLARLNSQAEGSANANPYATNKSPQAEVSTMNVHASAPATTPSAAEEPAKQEAAKDKASEDMDAKAKANAKARADRKAARAEKRKELDDEDAEDEEQDEEEEKEAKASLVRNVRALTGKRNLAEAFSVLCAWSATNSELRGLRVVNAVDALVAKAKAESKLDPDIESHLRMLAGMPGGMISAHKLVDRLPVRANQSPHTQQPSKPAEGTSADAATGRLTHKGKTFEQWAATDPSVLEALHASDIETFKALSADHDRHAR